MVSQIFSQQQSDSLLLWSHMTSNLVHLLAQLLYPPLRCNMISGLLGASDFKPHPLILKRKDFVYL